MSILISLAFNNNVEKLLCRKLQLLLRRVCHRVLPVICCFRVFFLLPPPAVAGIGDFSETDEEFGPGIGLAAMRMLQINTTLQTLTIRCELLLSQEKTFMTIFVQS
jgi:hypothetical protein